MSDSDIAPASLAEAALLYAGLGWHVLPLNGKAPLGDLVPHGYLDATTDAGTIRRWWEAAPDANIGIAAHASGLVVPDIDPRNGGAESLARLEAEIGPLAAEVMQFTGGGGQHLVYRANGLGWAPPKLAGYPGIDLKFDGYFVVEPSIHPDTGRRYAWEASSNPLDGVLPGELPEGLAGLLHRCEQEHDQQEVKAQRRAVLRQDAAAQGTADLPPIARFNAIAHWPRLLARYGYAWDARKKRWLSPHSTSGIAGVTLLAAREGDADQAAHAFVHHASDPLGDGRRHSAFDFFKLLEHGDDQDEAFAAALQILRDAPLEWPPAGKPKVQTGEPGQHRQRHKAKANVQAKAGAASQEEPASQGLPEPFPGPMAELVAAMLAASHRPREPLAKLAALVGMASCIHGGYAIGHGGGSRCNLYGLMTAPTGGGKEVPLAAAREIARSAGVRVEGKPASGAALAKGMLPYRPVLLAVNEYAFLLAATDAERAPSYLKDLSATLLELFSDSQRDYWLRQYAGDIAGKTHREKFQDLEASDDRRIPHPCLSLLLASAPEKLGASFASSAVLDGSLPRMLFVHDGAVVPRQWDPAAFAAPYGALAVANKLAVALRRRVADREFAIELPQIVIEVDALATATLRTHGEALDRQMGNNQVADAVLTRQAEKVLRVAGVLAAWDAPGKPRVSCRHMDWAIAFVRACDAMLLSFLGTNVFDNDGLRDAEAVRKVLRMLQSGRSTAGAVLAAKKLIGKGYFPRSLVLKYSHLTKKAFDEAVAHLVALEEVASVPTELGKPALITLAAGWEVPE